MRMEDNDMTEKNNQIWAEEAFGKHTVVKVNQYFYE